LDAHVDAVTLLREMGEKYRTYSDILVGTMKKNKMEALIPEMPEMSESVLEHQRSLEESLSESEMSDSSSMLSGSTATRD